ncbi:Hypothetical predicted protein [Olea europaea subsp. europaea]|uniref:Uncharacterized protein n=1 Tax=Olea europaea subsp. europaea TaxID=158383 RepID=A0A8S0T0T4_OLEEU|nr:Hypothetical predicted protein [Olea europaea subsp. europaea]
MAFILNLDAITLSNRQAAPSGSEAALDISYDNSQSHDRALPNSGNFRNLQVQQDVVMRLEEKVTSQSQVVPEPIRPTDFHGKIKILLEHKIDESYGETASTNYQSESSLKVLSSRVESGIGYEFSSPDNEDVCPKCLEEYTPEKS